MTRRNPKVPTPADGQEPFEVPLRLLLTVPEAAAALAISRSKLYELLTARKIRSVQIDGSRRIPTAALTEYVAALSEEAA